LPAIGLAPWTMTIKMIKFEKRIQFGRLADFDKRIRD
jgi:hypothetical protein